MDWEAIGAVGEVLGSLAVFITLGYLAVQIRHARSEARRALSQGRSEAHRDLLAQARDEAVLTATLKGEVALGAHPAPFQAALMDQAGLTYEEAFRVMNMNIAWWTYFLQIVPYVDELPPIERTAFENRVRGAYGRPGVSRLFFETYLKSSAHPNALRYVESVLAKPG
jgi:hypothetical protein